MLEIGDRCLGVSRSIQPASSLFCYGAEAFLKKWVELHHAMVLGIPSWSLHSPFFSVNYNYNFSSYFSILIAPSQSSPYMYKLAHKIVPQDDPGNLRTLGWLKLAKCSQGKGQHEPDLELNVVTEAGAQI